MGGRYCYKDVLPFTAMVTMECINVGLNTLFKAATLQGMSYHVFVVYAYAIAALVLFPAPFFSRRSRVLPPLNFSIMSKVVLLGIIGSPTLASAISNLVPAFTFILAIIFRMEKVALRSTSSQAKILGTIISISGAFVVTLYKGPPIVIIQTTSVSLNQPLNSLKSNWVIGGLLLTAEYILVPLWYIVQAQIMKEYPNELTVIFFYNLTVSIIAAVVGLITEKNPNAWRLRPNIALVSVVCSGIFGSFINNTVHAWALRVKGPLFVAMFKPLSIAIAVAMGVMFLSDTLYLGSLVGATIISFGFYTVMWGKAKEEIGVDHEVGILESPSSTQKTPLLQNYKAQESCWSNNNILRLLHCNVGKSKGGDWCGPRSWYPGITIFHPKDPSIAEL
nr:wat1-related protein [Quercus suber]